MSTGIRKRGSSYEASVFDVRTGKKVRRTFPTLAAAKSWRADATVAVRKGALQPVARTTVQEAAVALLDGMRDGSVRTRAGTPYRPTTIGQIERNLRLHVLPELAHYRLDRLTTEDLIDFTDRLFAKGLDAGTVQAIVDPVRLIMRREVRRGRIAHNPARSLALPRGSRRRDVVTDTTQAQRLLDALEPADRVIYATAFYAGLRRGELRALRWRHVDLARGAIHVEESASCDLPEPGDVKTDAGRRNVPIIAALRDHLVEHRMRVGEPAPDAFVFGAGDRPFPPSSLHWRASRAWAAAGLRPTSLHAARHTFASVLIAAGVNAKALTTYVGHASVSTTMDVYGWMMRGSEDEAVELINAYLARAAAADAPEMRQSAHGTTGSNLTQPDMAHCGNPSNHLQSGSTKPNAATPRTSVM